MPDMKIANRIREATTAFGDIEATNTTHIDLGEYVLLKHMLIENTLDEDVILTLGNQEITLTAFTNYVFSDFWHNDVVSIKHKGDAPTEGSLVTKHWGS